MTQIQDIGQNLTALREKSPLVHNITNYVVMNFSANALLAVGASPIMAHAIEEMEEMVSIVDVLVLNIGTLSQPWIESMILAGKTASRLGKPIILDPVGAGATSLRTNTAKRIIDDVGVSVIRGNASELMALGGGSSLTKGVDAIHGVDEAVESASKLARELNTVVAISGEVDLVTDGTRSLRIANGHALMTRITGTGCSLTAVTGAFLTIDDDPVRACASAFAYYGLAGEKAFERSPSPGSFGASFLDCLYEVTADELQENAKII